MEIAIIADSPHVGEILEMKYAILPELNPSWQYSAFAWQLRLWTSAQIEWQRIVTEILISRQRKTTILCYQRPYQWL
jgi:hypothetical protein